MHISTFICIYSPVIILIVTMLTDLPNSHGTRAKKGCGQAQCLPFFCSLLLIELIGYGPISIKNININVYIVIFLSI